MHGIAVVLVAKCTGDLEDKDTKCALDCKDMEKAMSVEGRCPIYDEKTRSQLGPTIHIDTVNKVKFAWRVQRDIAETEEQVKHDIEKRLPDFSAYADLQKSEPRRRAVRWILVEQLGGSETESGLSVRYGLLAVAPLLRVLLVLGKRFVGWT